jgi:hypothetical protein
LLLPWLPDCCEEAPPGEELPDWPWLLLGDWLLLDEELLLDWLLEDELLELLEDELLEEELLGEEGALVLGVEGVCGVVGLLALGQPLRTRQAHAGTASFTSHCHPVSINFICPDYLFRIYRFSRLEARPEPGFAQLAHYPVGPGPVDDLVVVYPIQVDHPPARGNPEF